MADSTTDLLNQVLSKLDEQAQEIKAIRQEHGAKLGDLELKDEVIIANQQHAAEQAQKDHMELMAHVIDVADQSSDAVHALEKRVERIEKHLDLPPVK